MVSDLYEALEHTEYGQTLLEQSRFGSFKPDWLPHEQWEAILGADVNNYYHQASMAALTGWYIEESYQLGDPVGADNEHALLVTAYVHDFAEAIAELGDVPDPLKKHDEETYRQEREDLITVLYAVTPEAEEVAEMILPIMQRTDPLGERWRALELMGYCETAIKAGDELANIQTYANHYAWSNQQRDEVEHSLGRLNREVFWSSTSQLQEFADQPVIARYLAEFEL